MGDFDDDGVERNQRGRRRVVTYDYVQIFWGTSITILILRNKPIGALPLWKFLSQEGLRRCGSFYDWRVGVR